MKKTIWLFTDKPHNNIRGYFESKPPESVECYEYTCEEDELDIEELGHYIIKEDGSFERMSDELFQELFPNYGKDVLKGNALQERKYTTYDNQILGLSSQDDFLEECLVEMAMVVYGSETQKVLEGGEDKVMAMLFAQRVILGKTLYKDVPAQLKSQVKEILIDSGMEFLIEE